MVWGQVIWEAGPGGVWGSVSQEAVRRNLGALAGVAQWIECQPANQRVISSITIRAHAWVVSQVPSRGCARGNHTLMFLSLSFSLPAPLSENK